MFYAWCGDRGTYTGSAYFLSWGTSAAHPEGYLIDRDGNIRRHNYGYSQAEIDAMEAEIKQMLGIA
jgi:hypothetical protein